MHQADFNLPRNNIQFSNNYKNNIVNKININYNKQIAINN
jgi:hypothetical protein